MTTGGILNVDAPSFLSIIQPKTAIFVENRRNFVYLIKFPLKYLDI